MSRQFEEIPSDQPKRCRKCLTYFDLDTGSNVSEKDASLCNDCDGSKEEE